MPSRSGFRLAVLSVLLVVLSGSAGAARADAPDWRAALGLSAEEAVTSSAADAKRRLAGVPGAEAVVSDADTHYPDGDRPANLAAAHAVFDHDRELAVSLQTRLNGGESSATLVAAAADLLRSERRTIEQMLGDIRLLAGTSSDETALEQAEQFHAQALAAWRRGKPVVLGPALLKLGADRLFDVLCRLRALLRRERRPRRRRCTRRAGTARRFGSAPPRHGPRRVDRSLRDSRRRPRTPSRQRPTRTATA